MLHVTAEARAHASSSYEGVRGPSGDLREGLAAGLTGSSGARNLYSLTLKTYVPTSSISSLHHQNVTIRAKD